MLEATINKTQEQIFAGLSKNTDEKEKKKKYKDHCKRFCVKRKRS